MTEKVPSIFIHINKIDKLCSQWRSQNGIIFTHIQENLDKICLELSQKWGLLLKERICSQREQILSFKSSPYLKEADVLCSCPFIVNIFRTHVTHLRNVRSEHYACVFALKRNGYPSVKW